MDHLRTHILMIAQFAQKNSADVNSSAGTTDNVDEILNQMKF